jgi:hypothetical protein
MLACVKMRIRNFHILLFLTLLVILQSNAQPDSCTSSVGIAYRPNGANFTPAPKYVRLFCSTSLSDSLQWYALVGGDFSTKPFTSIFSLEFGIHLTPVNALNIRPHCGVGGFPIGGKRAYDVYPFIYGGIALEANVFRPAFPGFSVEAFAPGSQPDFTMYIRYGF